MTNRKFAWFVGTTLLLLPAAQATAQKVSSAPLPDIHQLMLEVQGHQRQLDGVRESYTYSCSQIIQDLDARGQVTKTDAEEREDFFVHGHLIERTIKKNGQTLQGDDQRKETRRIAKLVEKAEQTPPGQPLEGQAISISRLLEIMEVRNPRREIFRGRPTIVFDFVGRKDAKTHGLAEDASKKVEGTVWIDEADRQVAHLEVNFRDNFLVAGGLFATIQKGTSFRFDQAPVAHPEDQGSSSQTSGNGELWLPAGAEGTMQARVLLLRSIRQHFVERDYDYKRFTVNTEQLNAAHVVNEVKP